MKKLHFLSLAFISALLLPLMGCSSCSSDNEEAVENKDNNSTETEYVKGNERIIYQVNPKLFSDGKAFSEIQSRLDVIKSLGANVLYIMPVYPQGTDPKSVGSPYCIKDYKAIAPRYGTLDEFKALVKAAQQKGMLFMMDWVANHTAWDNAWVKDHPDWYTQKNGQVSSPLEQNWPDVADLNYNNKDLRAAMIDAMKYWVNECGIDGFRCDYSDGVPDDFWQDAIQQLRAVKPGLLMLAEGTNVQQYKNGFDMIFSWSYPDKLVDVYAGKGKLADLAEINQREITAGEGKLPCRFTTNHDRANDNSPITLFKGEQGALSAFVLAIFQGGVPFIYSSQEIGYTGKLNIFNYYQIDWSKNPDYVTAYQKIMAAYTATAEARGGQLEVTDNNGVCRIVYTQGERELIVFVNTTNAEQQSKTPMSQVGVSYKELISGQVANLGSVVTLAPYNYVIYSK